ncbi:MAG: hypothetical protein GY775_11230 [Candidatus Scalindua sp.]|nr:hypothetical protein [Candidatus Scalindua sp.]
MASKDRCINLLKDTANLIKVIGRHRDVGLQSTKGYHHSLTLLGTATAVLNESHVYIHYAKGRR